MEKIQWRDLRSGAKVIERLPLAIVYDDVKVAVMLSLKDYNKLVNDYSLTSRGDTITSARPIKRSDLACREPF